MDDEKSISKKALLFMIMVTILMPDIVKYDRLVLYKID